MSVTFLIGTILTSIAILIITANLVVLSRITVRTCNQIRENTEWDKKKA